MSSWWDLPGPGDFVDDLADDLRDGLVLAVALPEPAPLGLPDAVRDALGARWGWRHLDRPPSAPPTEYLYERCLPQATTERRTPRTLVEEPDLVGSVIWVDHVAGADLPAWRSFLLSYAEAARGTLHDYARFALCARGEGAEAAARGASGLGANGRAADLPLAHHRWAGRAAPLDMLSFAARVHHGREPTPLEQRLAVELVARLAAFDPRAAAHLADLSLRDLHRPAEALAALARQWGWPQGDAARDALTAPDWHRGMTDSPGDPAQASQNAVRVHPALLAAAGDGNALDRLVWQAQISVVFPFLEERRRDLLDVLDPVLEVPFEHGHGVVAAKHDLELGHLYTQLARLGSRGASSLLSLVGAFRDARNHLAHLRPLRPEVFRTPPFHAYHAPLAAAARRLSQP